jgi:hypothetical protein
MGKLAGFVEENAGNGSESEQKLSDSEQLPLLILRALATARRCHRRGIRPMVYILKGKGSWLQVSTPVADDMDRILGLGCRGPGRPASAPGTENRGPGAGEVLTASQAVTVPVPGSVTGS